MIQQLPMEIVSSVSNGKGWAKVGAQGLERFFFLLLTWITERFAKFKSSSSYIFCFCWHDRHPNLQNLTEGCTPTYSIHSDHKRQPVSVQVKNHQTVWLLTSWGACTRHPFTSSRINSHSCAVHLPSLPQLLAPSRNPYSFLKKSIHSFYVI